MNSAIRRWPAGLFIVIGLAGCGQFAPSEAGGGLPGTAVMPLAFDRIDRDLVGDLEGALQTLGLTQLVEQQRMGVALVDMTDPSTIRYAGINDNLMLYAASLPKIAILLTAFELMEEGEIDDTREIRETLTAMIRVSSNPAATRALRWVGFESIERTLRKPEYQLYDARGQGGLWVGKAYDPTPAEHRDPLFQYSHGATARQAARFFALLDRGLLVSPERSRQMKEILGDPGIHHKFVKGLSGRPDAEIYRKSGTYRGHHADAALIEHNGKRYVAAALVDDPRGGVILERLIVALDDIIARPHHHSSPLAAGATSNPDSSPIPGD